MNDDDRSALKRLTDLWGRWYEVTFADETWRAKRCGNGLELTSDSSQGLHVMITRNYLLDLRMPMSTRGPAITQEMALAEVRRKHCTEWDYIGRDPESPGWRASRTLPGGITHHVGTRTLAELCAALCAADEKRP